jgi:hypothetical protein
MIHTTLGWLKGTCKGNPEILWETPSLVSRCPNFSPVLGPNPKRQLQHLPVPAAGVRQGATLRCLRTQEPQGAEATQVAALGGEDGRQAQSQRAGAWEGRPP